MPFQTPITIARALEKIHRREYVLPAIQREFVWSPEQIARLFDSLMQGYPIGSFLFWNVDKEHCRDYEFYEFMQHYHARTMRRCKKVDLTGEQGVTAILDGQQRLTSLNIGLRGSHAEKLPRKRAANLDAYPVRHLFLNLNAKAPENELGLDYDFKFMTQAQADAASLEGKTHWFRVGRILELESGPDLYDYIEGAKLADKKFGYRTLDGLKKVVTSDALISFYEEEDQNLDKVLNIFIRVNSAGEPLSYSDLLLSIATAQWEKRDAREAIHTLVDDLNSIGSGFAFSKDLVLKAGLVLTEVQSIGFKVTNFNSANMRKLDEEWDGVARALRIAVQLLASFGFSASNLSAASVVIPLAYYAHRANLPSDYSISPRWKADRDKVRPWVMRSLLKSGIWGSGLDTLLGKIRAAIRDHADNGFPTAEIEVAMGPGKSLRFEEEEIQDLLDVEYGDPRIVPLLTLLYPGTRVDLEYHVDHIFPRAKVSAPALTKAGVPREEQPKLIELVNRLGNLQLLEGQLNNDKRARMPLEWLKQTLPEDRARETYIAGHDLADISDELTGLERFYTQRRSLLEARLRRLLAVR